MSIDSVVRRFSVQTAVYWGNPVKDGFGGMSYDEPIEVKVRWEEGVKVYSDNYGKEIRSDATILSPIDLDIQGIIWLGNLLDLDKLQLEVEIGENYPRPELLIDSFEITSKEKIPMVRSTTVFVRQYFLRRSMR
ncbi:MAG: hypothetical protein WC942_02875 [Clostridia bacterium]|jgi:hypothetical protein